MYAYSRLSLSRLSRITPYLEVKIWSLFWHGNLTTGNKILWKRGEIAPLSYNIFNISINFRSQLHIHLLNMFVRFIVFLNSANLICRGTDILKYSIVFLGLRDNESRLYCFFTVKMRIEMEKKKKHLGKEQRTSEENKKEYFYGHSVKLEILFQTARSLSSISNSPWSEVGNISLSNFTFYVIFSLQNCHHSWLRLRVRIELL